MEILRSPGGGEPAPGALAPVVSRFRLVSLPDQQHFANFLAPEVLVVEVCAFFGSD